jgi:hypothetical protein
LGNADDRARVVVGGVEGGKFGATKCGFRHRPSMLLQLRMK